MSILALETSCDDTCAAVIDEDGRVRANVISSQVAHEDFGGVVPEIASRHHLEIVNAIVERALREAAVGLDEVDLIAATQGPGLVGALLVGLATAKALAAARELPFAPVDHLQGHVAANFLLPDGGAAFEPPFLCLIASGGHTLLTHVREHDGFEVLGRTLDDAAGEAFDKGARMLGLGYPGGAALEALAREGDAAAFAFPGSRAERARGGRGAHREAFARGLDFSFAGLKTALLYKLRELSEEQAQARAGVAANGALRARLAELDVTLHVPARVLCTDNAAMIASAARYGEQLAYPLYLALDAYATGERAR
jgi:N6-L-threonylcarbamoyladenine synthase